MELKTVKEFAHKNNLGEGLKFESGLFQLDLDKEFNTIASSLNQLNTKLTLVNEQLGTVYKVEGSTKVDDINSMTVGNAMIGYVYNLLDSGVITNGLTGEIPVEAGDNVVYTENGWDKLSAALKIALEAGNNIAIEGNKINALGYWHDKTKDAIKTNLNYNIATGLYSLAQNEGTQATGKSSHAEGGLTVAEGDYSHAEGKGTQTKNEGEHAEGKYNVSNVTDWAGDTIHSIGIGTSDENRKNALEVTTQGAVYMKDVGGYDGTTIAGVSSVQSVINTLVNTDIPNINQRIDDIPTDLSNVITKTDDYQIALGTDNNPTHEKTLLIGTGLATSNNESLVVGAYNNAELFSDWGVDAPAIQVGAGTEDSKRTVMVIQKNGKSLGLLGFEQNGLGDFAEYFEWADGNPEGEDRVGYMVLLNDGKIEFSESLDNCIGIITGTGSFVADSACLDWHGRYLKDKWGRNVYELTGVLAENPDYDPTKEYIPREYRKEWSPVGLIGKIIVRQDGTLKPNGFVGCVNGIATNVDKSSWRVLKVIDEEIALVLIK